MANITCCEIVFIVKELADKVLKETNSELEKNKSEESNATIKIWKTGTEYSFVLILDKLWKEDKLCSACANNFKIIQSNFQNILIDLGRIGENI